MTLASWVANVILDFSVSSSPFGLDFGTKPYSKYYLHFNKNRKELHFQDVNTILYLISPFLFKKTIFFLTS